MLRVSVIIPVYNGGSNFRRCLASLAETVPPPSEVIVVADGDTDGSWLVARDSGAEVVRIPESGGPARARNIGAQRAGGDVLLFVDADVTVCSDAVAQVAAAFQENPQVAAIFGSYDDKPGATNFLSQYKNLFHHYVHQTACEDASTFWGACGAIRRDVFFEMGGFDESYRKPSIEDVELGYRLRRAGYRIQLRKSLQVKHLKRWGVMSLLKSDLVGRALPWTEVILRERRFINDLNLKLSGRVSVALACGMAGLLVSAWWKISSLALAGVFALSLTGLNRSLYRFFLRKRGFGFTLLAIPWHWFYCFYSGVGFVAGAALYLIRRLKAQGPTVGSCPVSGSDWVDGR